MTSNNIQSEIDILIVEDKEHKYSKISDYIKSISPKSNICLSTNQLDAQLKLESKKYDLLLLDMCLPLRSGDVDLDSNGGVNILDELDSSDCLFQPDKIIAMTEFENLKDEVRENYPELGVIKFDPSSNDWQQGIYRSLKSISKGKSKKIIIYCEEQNDKLYNLLGFHNIEFRGLKGGSRKVYEAAKFEKDKYAIRDKDYLTKNEISWLTKSHFKNYLILDYYCFENYLFHPDNIEEYCLEKGLKFDVGMYKNEIIRQKNENFLNIVQYYILARNSYFDFNDNSKANMDKEPQKEIVEGLKSDDFETFYPHFDMKGTDKRKGFDKSCLDNLNLDKEELVKTKWFIDKMRPFFEPLM